MTEAGTLARGTFTFLFSDIEGSTRIEQAIGRDRYAELRGRHRELLRAATEAHGGIEQGTEGDSLFVAFHEAPDAVEAAVAAQRALVGRAVARRRDDQGPDGPPHRRCRTVRGEPRRSRHQPGGAARGRLPTAGRSSRPAWSATSSTTTRSTASRCGTSGSTGSRTSARRCGSSRSIADGLPSDFPALRSLDARPNNLPTQLTTFVGRDAELEAAARLLAGTRLLTLTGPGGTGKTRLSLQLAARSSDDFPDGVFFVPLEPIRDPMLVAPRIASALGVAESTGRPIQESLGDWLRDKRLLLVLDNFEQVVAAASIVADLLRAAPEIKAVVTSRAVLRVSGEQEYEVPGLPAPPDPSQESGMERMTRGGGDRPIDLIALGQYAAVRLFIERAVAVRPGFARHQRERPGGGRDQRPAPRDAARDRARRGPHQAAQPRRDPGPARSPARCPGGRRARPARASADASRRDRLELRPARRRREAAARSAVGVRRRVRSRLGRGDLRSVVRDRWRHPRRADGTRRPEPGQGRGDRRRRDALPAPGHDPGVRGGTARGRRGDRPHPRPPSRLVRGARPAGGRRAVRARPAALARPARARARRHPRRPRPRGRGARPAGRDRGRLLDVALLAEARPPGRSAPTARGDGVGSRGRTTTLGCAPSSRRRSAGRAGGRATSTG